MLFEIKKLLTNKGGRNMELRKKLMDVIDDLRNGNIPVKTAKHVHLTAHRIVGDKNADCRTVETMGKQEQVAKSMEAMKEVR